MTDNFESDKKLTPDKEIVKKRALESIFMKIKRR